MMEKQDGVSYKKEQGKMKAPCTAVVFLGSNTKGVVKDADILDYAENFDKLTRKKSILILSPCFVYEKVQVA